MLNPHPDLSLTLPATHQRIIDVVSTVSHRARDSYIAITDDSPPSFVASLTSLVFSFRFTELLSGFSMSLPPPPSPSLRSQAVGTPPAISSSAPPTPSLKGKEKEEPSVNGSAGPTPITSPILPSSPLQGDGAASLAAEAAAIANTASAVGANGAEPGSPKAVQAAKREDKTSENAFKKMPPEIVAILLPFYDLLNLNKAFCALVFNETSEGGEFLG